MDAMRRVVQRDLFCELSYGAFACRVGWGVVVGSAGVFVAVSSRMVIMVLLGLGRADSHDTLDGSCVNYPASIRSAG